MARLLVLVTSNVFPAEMGGQKAVVLFYEALKKHHDVFFAATPGNDSGGRFSIFPVLYPNRQMPLNLLKIPTLIKLIKENNIDLLIAEHSYTAWLAAAVRRYTGLPFVIRSHNIEAFRFRQLRRWWWKAYLQFEGWSHRPAAHHFFISEEDQQFAMHRFHLQPGKCTVAPYSVPPPMQIDDAKRQLRTNYGLVDGPVFYFNGTLNYGPNTDAVEKIIFQISPLLAAQNLACTILISGRFLSEALQQKMAADKRMKYLGFVNDTALLYQGCDAFINPVTTNAGVKTKLVEALANHCTVVSTVGGMGGIPAYLYGNNVLLCADDDWPQFVQQMIAATQKQVCTPAEFFTYYSAERIAANAAETINALVKI